MKKITKLFCQISSLIGLLYFLIVGYRIYSSQDILIFIPFSLSNHLLILGIAAYFSLLLFFRKKKEVSIHKWYLLGYILLLTESVCCYFFPFLSFKEIIWSTFLPSLGSIIGILLMINDKNE